jgi:Helix-turn-helix domain
MTKSENTKMTKIENAEIFQLLNTSDAAKRLGISPRTLEGWRISGCGPRFLKVSDRCVRYSLSELMAFTESNSVSNTIQARQLLHAA